MSSEARSDRWIVVIWPSAEPELVGPMNEAELVEKLKGWYGSRVKAFPFTGTPYFISKYPFRTLICPLSEKTIPLHPARCGDKIDETGSLFDGDESFEDDNTKKLTIKNDFE